MISPADLPRVLRTLPFLRQAEARLLQEFQQAAYLARIPAGKDVFVEGDRVHSIALLVSGVVRVYQIGETGREITLYRFGLGQSCILTANAILNEQTFPAIATVEQDAEAVMVPDDVFREWVRRHDLWRSFVFDLLSQRLASVMAIVEEVAFHRMDTRLAAFLLERSRSAGPLHMTHQEIAAELGSAREVVSRILEDFAAQGLIRASRGLVEVADPEGLAGRAAA